jgi:uncharacterized protein (TIGR02466 family)
MSFIKIESFTTPIFLEQKNEWLNNLNLYCDPYIDNAKKDNKKIIEENKIKFNKDIKDFGITHHSLPLYEDINFQEFNNYIKTKSYILLEDMGYDLSNYNLYFTELWVQEFAEQGGGHHEGHIHYDNHISGFYFLKCSDKTSYPIFHDPRTAKLMSQLPLKDENELTFASNKIHIKPNPGTLIFFPAYLEHQFTVDYGIEPFRFIHFNLQAVRKIIINSISK